MSGSQANRMTRTERTELLSLIRKREKVMKTMASDRSAQMLAEFEAQAAKIYDFNDDEIWKAATEEAMKAAKIAQTGIEKRCKELGIPKEFAPSLEVAWFGRGENAVSMRRAELRRAAKARIAAIETQAISRIEQMSMEAQSELLSHGLDTDAAQKFLAAAKADMIALMPSLVVIEVEKMIEPTFRRRLATSYH